MRTVTPFFPPADNNIGFKYCTPISRIYEWNECTVIVKKYLIRTDLKGKLPI